jgi:hypothetical protein
MSKAQHMIDAMKAGNIQVIQECIHSEKAILIVNAIIFGVQQELDSPSFISGVEKAAQNQTVLMGHRVSEFAVAALDILGKQKYTGTQQSIKDMIQFKMNL